MLQYDYTTDESAVEILFCEPFKNLRQNELDDDLFNILLTLNSSPKVEFSTVPEKEKLPLFKLIENSLNLRFTFKIRDFRLIIMIAAVSKSAGTAIMYLTYLQYFCKTHNLKELDFETFCREIFPLGFPDDKELSKLWTNQKVNSPSGSFGSDNLIDYQSAMKSIQFL